MTKGGGRRDRELLGLAVEALLYQVDSEESETRVLWNMFYTQCDASDTPDETAGRFCFPAPSVDLAFDDRVLEAVRAAWRFALGDEAKDDEFLCFADREGEEDE